MNDLRIDF